VRARGKDKLQRGKSKGIRTEKKREREREREKTRKKKPYDRSVEGARKQRRGW